MRSRRSCRTINTSDLLDMRLRGRARRSPCPRDSESGTMRGWRPRRPNPHHPRRLQPLRGDLRARADHRGRPGHRDPRQRRRPALPRLHLPQGRLARRHPRRPGPAAAPGTPGRRGAGRRVGGDLAGTRRSTWSPTGSPARSTEHGRNARRRLPRQPERALRSAPPRTAPVRQEPAHPQPVQRLVGRPDPAPVRRAGRCTATSCCCRSPTSTGRRTSWSSAPTRWRPTAR